MKKCPKCGTAYEDVNTLCPADGTVLEKAGDELVGKTLAGKYRIDGRISEGGMGTVYRATHILMEKTVAIKVLHPSLAADEKIVARFSREAKAASRISHPHALNVTDFGEAEEGVVFLVMEYLRGRTLKEVVRATGQMALPRVVEIIRQVSGALGAAHAEGVVHRDLKSDNIMLEEVGAEQDWAKVLDFGIAKIIQPSGGQDPELTAPNLIIGTPQYMSPEQCSQASEIDARSDLYSLGVILYELLTGHVPFTGDSPTVIMMKHLQEPPPSVLEERKDLPPAVGRVVAKALSKRPEDRYQSASQFSEELTLAAADEPSTSAAAATDTASTGSDLNTKRIIVPTAASEIPRDTANEERDETTVVRERVPPGEVERPGVPFDAPPPSSGLNPWRILIPAAVLLAVVFAMFYAFQRNAGETTPDNQTAPLASDPNSKPVQPVGPATGAGEQDVAPGGAGSPAASPSAGMTPPATRDEIAVPATLPTPVPGRDTNRNDNAQENTNAEEPEEPEPTPEPTNRNSNRRRTPPPPPAQTSPEVIPEKPTPAPTAKELPTVTPPSAEISPAPTGP